MPLEPVEAFIRAHREDMPDLTFMHVLMAAMVRMIAEKPYLNRFVVWNKIYARNSINISLMIKRKGSNVETMIKPEFQPEDTLKDVVDRVSALVNVNILEDAQKRHGRHRPVLRLHPRLDHALHHLGDLPPGQHRLAA